MNCYNACKKMESFTLPPTWEIQANQYEQHQSEHICSSIPMDIDSFVSNLPNLDELEANNNHQQLMLDNLVSDHNQHLEPVNDESKTSSIRLIATQDLNMYSMQHNHIHNQPLISIDTTQENKQFLIESNFTSMINMNHMNFKQNQYSQQEIGQAIPSNQQIAATSYEPMSKVEILNHIISNASSLNYLPNEDSESYPDSDFSSNELGSRRKMIKGKTTQKTKCSVCGNESSGFHYGAHTCEACKLFFRRAEKSIRKSGFTDCPKKNCLITSENRANCSQCRYKKCIAAGMSMTRSRYGRHTERISSSYLPYTSESLCSLIDKLKGFVKLKSITFDCLNELTVNFYLKSIKLLENVNTDTDSGNLRLPCEPPLSEISSIISSPPYYSNEIQLPNSILILFCVLFNLKAKLAFNFTQFDEIFKEFEYFVQFVRINILLGNEFGPMLRIGIFIKVLRIILEAKPCKNDIIDKRVTDLMRSEFALFKINSNDTTSIAMLFSQLNHILFKHMSEWEFKNFVIKRCF